ncbi:hypothetical protein BSKO_13424 [Bryopsis sp. KO-2023]|nr:hypothetical protein BSKO_13424 [Bryopsis sp. KO-2023]
MSSSVRENQPSTSMVQPICIPALFMSLFITATTAQFFNGGLDLAEGCEGFQDLEFITPYNKSQEKMLAKEYFGASEKNVSILFAQRGSCCDYKACLGAGVSSFYLCSLFSTITQCMGFEGWPALVFDNCTDSHCEFVMPPAATKCLYHDGWEMDPYHQAADACSDHTDHVALGVTPMQELNGSHCMIPLPRGSTLLKQMECSDPGNEHWMRWWFDFLRPVSKSPFACLWLSKCKTLEDPLDFICIRGKKDAVKILRETAMKAYQNDEMRRNASMPDIRDFTTLHDDIENGTLRCGECLLFVKPMVLFFLIELLRFLV